MQGKQGKGSHRCEDFLQGLVRKKGLEPLRPFSHQLLRLARLPIPPLPRSAQYNIAGESGGLLAAAATRVESVPIALAARHTFC